MDGLTVGETYDLKELKSVKTADFGNKMIAVITVDGDGAGPVPTSTFYILGS